MKLTKKQPVTMWQWMEYCEYCQLIYKIVDENKLAHAHFLNGIYGDYGD